VVLRDLARNGYSGVDLDLPLIASEERNVKRWVAARPTGARAWLRVRQPDGHLRELLVWQIHADAPLVESALGRLVARGRVLNPSDLTDWPDRVFSITDRSYTKGTRVLTGTTWLVSRIHQLRDRVVAARALGDGMTRVTLAPPQEVLDAVEKAVGAVVRVTGRRRDGGADRYVRHEVYGRLKGPPTVSEMNEVFCEVGAQGTWRRSRKRRPVDPEVEWFLDEIA
jgi:hypothetical protein